MGSDVKYNWYLMVISPTIATLCSSNSKYVWQSWQWFSYSLLAKFRYWLFVFFGLLSAKGRDHNNTISIFKHAKQFANFMLIYTFDLLKPEVSNYHAMWFIILSSFVMKFWLCGSCISTSLLLLYAVVRLFTRNWRRLYAQCAVTAQHVKLHCRFICEYTLVKNHSGTMVYQEMFM